jgi:hypothetical protein
MSASGTFFTLADPVPSTGTSLLGLNAAARSLEMRKTTGGGPTSAIGLSSGTAAYADQMRVTAVDGMIMAPLFVTACTTATRLQISKSSATYFLACGNNTGVLTLQLPPLSGIVGNLPSAAVAGFKARFVATAALASGSNINIVPEGTTTARPVFLGSIVNSGAITPAGTGTNLAITSPGGTLPSSALSLGKSCIALAGTASGGGLALVSGSVVAGDWVEFETDGVSWYVRGVVAAYNAVSELA